MSPPDGQAIYEDSDAITIRPWVIQVGNVRIRVPVSAKSSDWIAAEILREEFVHATKVQDAVVNTEELDRDKTEVEVELLAKLLVFVTAKVSKERTSSCTLLLLAIFRHFTSTYLSTNDVHTLVSGYDTFVRKDVLTGYFAALSMLESLVDSSEISRSSLPALFTAVKNSKASVYALFGGQGTNEVYFDELQSLYDIYKPYVSPFIASLTHNVLVPLATTAQMNNFAYYPYGLDVYGWLEGITPRPSLEYLASIPLSFPLIGLTQLTQYLTSTRVMNLTPGEMRQLLAGTTGHSQGIVSAVVISTSDSFDSFTKNSEKALKWLFYCGLRGQEAFPIVSVEPSIVQDSIQGGEGTPSPMLAVTGLPLTELQKFITTTNTHLPENSKLYVSLHNGPKAFVVTGPAKALYGLVNSLRKVRAPSGLDQSKVPFSQRKPVFSVRFLVVNVPYHSEYLHGVAEKVITIDLSGEELWTTDQLSIPVYHTEDGTDLRSLQTSLTRSLCDQIFNQPIHWKKATDFPSTATHAIDFGPGGLSGIGGLTARNLEGRGVRVIIVGEKGRGSSELYDPNKVNYEECWAKKFAPRLVKTSDGKIHLDTPYSRLIGKPPIMVAGMTPSTVKAGFVSAILSAGYHTELAGGGHYNASAIRAKVAEIQKNIPAGVGLTLNSLYINPRQFGFQFPLWQEMRKEGLPIEGFCVAAGVPTTEKAAEIILGLQNAGIKHVAFKPGSVDGIRQVVSIAAAHPDYPIILQWTGGRAGGHHSCEDFHQPIIATYGAIRQQKNIALIAGSGFGGADDFYPYLTGEWSVEKYGVQAMPFDGLLLASRVMVAKEAHTSSSVKDLIVAAPGVVDSRWEGTYTTETGGILTVRSELGEPIHKIATRGVKLWKEFDNTVFNMSKDKRATWLQDNRDSVVEKLNRDFSKPWFARKKDGTVVYDLGDMTYEEVTLRLVRLTYVSHQSRWIDSTLRNLVGDWLRRVEERFAAGSKAVKASILQNYSRLDNPQPVLDEFFEAYPDAKEQLLASEDKAYFLAISQRPGQKPVPFVPVLDANFEVWFKKDSLWAAEDIDAVFDQDPQRVCILQGPVAARHSVKKDEPIKELLGNIESTLIQKVSDQFYKGDETKIPQIEYIGCPPPRFTGKSLDGVSIVNEGDTVVYKITSKIPDAVEWRDFLSGPSAGWLRAFLTSPMIVQDSGYINNPILRMFAPRAGQSVHVKYDQEIPIMMTLYGCTRLFGPHKAEFKAVEVVYTPSTRKISLVLFEDRKDASVALPFEFEFHPDQGYAPIHEVSEGRNKRIKSFYWKLWFGDDKELPEVPLKGTFLGSEVTVDASAIEQFCSVIGNHSESFVSSRTEVAKAPMDFSIVTGWQAIIQAIFPDAVDGDLLKLVHLSNGFRLLPGARLLQVGDVCRAEAQIISVTNGDSGKVVKVKGTVIRDGEHVMEVTSSFLYRGRFTDYFNTFEIIQEPDYVLDLANDLDMGVLKSKEWFQWDDASAPLAAGTSLIFKTQSELTYKDRNVFASIKVTGAAYTKNHLKQLKKVATIDYELENAHGNVVLGYLKRHGKALGSPVLFETGGYTLTSSEFPAIITAPLTNEPYSKISGDFNPIHVNPYFSDYAALPGTITHGMWSSAATRKYVENVAARGVPERVHSYNVTFVGMVLPGEQLNVKLKHIGMRDGSLVIKVETFNEQGDKILEGSAEVAQPTTAYVFTGQGSQEPGMGMELYNTSLAARAVWDSADAHLRAVYGFSIVDIVKNNPKSKTIHFGGIKGQAIRQRYMDMSYDTMDKDGNVKTLPLFADIDVRTPAYTFSHPSGLLFATQFAQIALVVTEKAAFEDMRSKGLVAPNSPFAGHSLGEYSALASIADVLPISSLVDIVFYRGITMQRAVERDAHNRSNYAMCAVNPSRISKTFNEAALREVVDAISTKGSVLLEIVNFNVDGQQYVCAGELVALQALTNVLNYLKVEKVDIAKLTEKFSVEKVREMLMEIVEQCLQRVLEQQKVEGYVQLERGYATIPLPGIDVPFHSRYLWAGVMPFRAYLSKKINPLQLDPDMLIGKYIPNLTAEPFEVSQAYAQRIYDQTSSPRLDKVLRHWDRDNWGAPEQRQKLAYVILVELLSYQFASAVRWIETQDRLFVEYKFERLIELGPGPTLTGMATRTLKAKYEVSDDSVSRVRAILCHAKHPKEIYYLFEDEAEAPSAEESVTEPAAAVVPAATPVVPVPVVASNAGPAASVPEEPLKAVNTLRIIVAQKLKKRVDEVPLSKSIKDLVGGKSTLQNEILGDLQLEFTSAPEKGEELSLDELGSALSMGYSGSLGKYTSGLVSRLVSSKMPGGFNVSMIKSYLSKSWGLGTARADGLLLLGVTLEPAKRLGSETEAKSWLDTVVAAYAQQQGISLASGGGATGTGGGLSSAVINSEEFLKFQAEQERFAAQQVEVYMRYLNRDSRSGEQACDTAKEEVSTLQSKLDNITREHGETYVDGIQPMFEPLKARHFDSSWNWVRQDALIMWYDIIHGRLTAVDREITARCIAIMNRADAALLEYMQYHIDTCDPKRGETYRLAKEFGQQLIDNCREAVEQPPLYKDVTFPTAPCTQITEKGDIVYSEVVRENVRKLEAYVEEMASGDTIPGNVNIEKVQDDVQKLWNVVKSQPGISQEQKNRIRALYEGVVRSLRKGPELRARVGIRNRRSSSQFLRPQLTEVTSLSADKIPLLHLKRRVGVQWEYSSNLTSVYLDVLKEIATSGTTFKDKNALLTGVGKGSIGVEVLKGLLSGGARVVVTTSRYSRSTVEFYQDIYQKFGARGSALTVVPFNQGSKQDVETLIDYIYATLSMDLDYILPFAAVPENGREIDGLDDKSELAHRIMLVNLLRLMGAVKNKKASRQFVTRPTQVILPLSPNHGLFGSDGLYSESKISLETLFNRWNSERWGEYLCLAGAVIGWTRGTGVMAATNTAAHQIEAHGVRTFSSKEMAFNILGLMHPLLFSITQVEPIWADLAGGMDRMPDLGELFTRIRNNINQQSELRRAITRDNAADFALSRGPDAERVYQTVPVTPRANFKFDFPKLENTDVLEQLSRLRGLMDLEKIIVITGFAEVGPWGSSRTRWEMEAIGEFTIEGCIEMAWIMGHIKHFDGRLKDGSLYVGWVDGKTGDPIDDKDIKGKYEKDILSHAGVRLIEPELHRGYDPKKKVFFQEVELTHDLEPIEASESEARKFKLQHGDKCDIWRKVEEQFYVKLKKGALIKIPKAFHFSTLVAGQIPTGWYAGRYGIPEDIIAQTDRTALWALVCAAEALIMSGITDPYELYKFVHPSEVGSSIGSGMGGMTSIAAMFKDRREELEVQKDILQETFINTVAGWVNMLLLSSSGPIKIPVGACATALQSLEIACDTILNGKAKVMLAGGFDDFSEEGSFEFANMKATSNSIKEFAAGREPTEFSRPTTSTRGGFMESQGSGVQVIMSAKLALEMGAPIRGIVAFTSTSTDKAGRSVPAPGQGVLTIGRESTESHQPLVLDLDYRTRQLAFRRKQISQWIANEHEMLREEIMLRRDQGQTIDKAYIASREVDIEQEALRQEKSAQATFGMLEGTDSRVAPLRRALAIWGLSADDIGVISIHGTSTMANEANETHVYNDIFTNIGRTRGNAVPVMAQKSLTGHAKGGAAAWQLIGLCQTVNSGIIPGNRNADNVDKDLQQWEYLMFPSKSIHTDGITAGLMTSFGFGQVGGSALIVHPRHLFATLEPSQYDAYKILNRQRALSSYKSMTEMMTTNSLVKVKGGPPYTPELERLVLLNPLARAQPDKNGSYSFPKKLPSARIVDDANVDAISQLVERNREITGVGVDQELISSVPTSNPTFIVRNFTDAEVAYCRGQPSPSASFAARWVGKEAVFKALGVPSKGAGAPMKDIEILPDEAGRPVVILHGEAKTAAESQHISSINVSLSHSDYVAIAFATAQC